MLSTPQSTALCASDRGSTSVRVSSGKSFLLHVRYVCLFILASMIFSASNVVAQPVPFDKPSNNAKYDAAKDIGFAQGSFIVAPIPFQNPALKSGLALGGAYLFKNPGSATSSIGFGGFRTSNGSQGYGLGFNLNFADNRWKTGLFAGDIDLNYDLYVQGNPVPISQTGRGIRGSVEYGLRKDLFVGAGLGYATSTIAPNFGLNLPPEISTDADLKIASLNLLVTWDRRDDTYYPTAGSFITGDVAYSKVSSARDRNYIKAVAKAAGYKKIFGNGVIAWQAAACGAGSEAPFFDSCSLGGMDNFRGFSSAEYIDDALLSFQIEYRGIIGGRFGYVAFAGAGSVGDDFGDVIAGTLRSAAGVGARFRLSKKFPLDYSVDFSYNNADESLVYVYVGQRF